MYNYYFVNLKVKPKMEALAMAEAALEETERTLMAAIERLKEVEEGIETLRGYLRVEEEKKAELEKEKQLCEDRMARAVRLVVGLAGEQIRWLSTVADLNKSLKNAVGDILLASGTNSSSSFGASVSGRVGEWFRGAAETADRFGDLEIWRFYDTGGIHGRSSVVINMYKTS